MNMSIPCRLGIAFLNNLPANLFLPCTWNLNTFNLEPLDPHCRLGQAPLLAPLGIKPFAASRRHFLLGLDTLSRPFISSVPSFFVFIEETPIISTPVICHPLPTAALTVVSPHACSCHTSGHCYLSHPLPNWPNDETGKALLHPPKLRFPSNSKT